MGLFNFHQDLALNEWGLYNDNTLEFIEMYGVPILYLLRTAVKEDALLGEDALSTYSETKAFKVYLEDNTNFGGGGDLWGKFGFVKDDTMKIKIQKQHLIEMLGTTPKENDIIQFGFNKKLYEVFFIEEDVDVFFLAGNQTTYGISVRLMSYSNEILETGDTEIDKLNDENNKSTNDDSVREDDFAAILKFNETNPFGDTF